MEVKLLIFDLDDTLIKTQFLYDDAKVQAADLLESLGFDFEESLSTIKQVDTTRTIELGTSKHRFPLSMALAYEELSNKYFHKLNPSIVDKLKSIGYNVFDSLAYTFPYSKKILTALSKEYTMCVLTRGEKDIQSKRLLDSGLINFFDQFFVVEKKMPETFSKICSFYGVAENESMMVGNSIYGDIYPALEAGLFGFWVKNGTYELDASYSISPENKSRMIISRDIRSLPDVLNGE